MGIVERGPAAAGADEPSRPAAASVPEAAANESGTAASAPEAGWPRFSVVVPIHNEAECLVDEVAALVGEMEARGIGYELLLVENGSTDDTPALAESLAAANPRVHALRVHVPDYGAAMRTGMLSGRGDLVVNFDIDFHDVDFMLQAGELLTGGGPQGAAARPAAAGAVPLPAASSSGVDSPGVAPGTVAGDRPPAWGVVVGSKLVEGAEDRRSVGRRIVSLAFTTILRVLFDRHMDDTHGMKVLRREVVERFAPRTVMTRDLFDTELIIRARRGGVKVKALPVTVEEKRKPRSSIVRRIPRTVKGLIQLRLILWKEGNAGS